MGTLKKLFLFCVLATGASIAFTVAQFAIFDPAMITPWGMIGSTASALFALSAVVIWGTADIVPWIKDRYWLWRSARRVKEWDTLRPDPMRKWYRVW